MPTNHAVLSLALFAGLCVPAFAGGGLGGAACRDDTKAAAPGAKPTAVQPATVQLAILLDTSGSMDGLIEQAKAQLWTIVNQFATSKHQGQRPKLLVALYHYGNDSVDAKEQHVQMLLPLTDDLDAVSEKLFALKTNGGSEYCGAAIDKATRELAWSSNSADLKILVIAGNEPFTQGDTDYHNSIPAAVKKNIIINTIFCGDKAEGEKTNWKDGAVLGEGNYAHIDQNSTPPSIPTPHDEAITSLGVSINATYIAFGKRAEEGKAKQTAQDSNAASVAPATAAARSVSKASGLYNNRSWDLVDALSDNTVALKDIDKDDLPKEMQSMTLEEREAHVKKLGEQRKAIQSQIAQLEVKRQAYIAEERRKQAGTTKAETLGEALLKAIREQATKKGYTFEDAK
jgi:von Willebrand factor type A domain